MDAAEHLGARLETSGYAAKGGWALRLPDGHSQGHPALRQRLASLPPTTDPLLLFQPALALMPLLLQRLPADSTVFTPRDSETAVFLTDIPLLDAAANPLPLLTDRRALWWQDAFLLRAGSAHQASVLAACLHHALLVAGLAELWQHPAPELKALLADQTHPLPTTPGDALDRGSDRDQAIAAGAALVHLGLVDAVFGNLSVRDDDRLLISCTGSALDALANDLCTVSLAHPAEGDRRASSELPAHRTLYAARPARVLLHGHPRLAIALSLTADGRQRLPDGTPVVWAAPGSAELGQKLAAAARQDACIMAGGHGPFILADSFTTAVERMIQLENQCRRAFRERLAEYAM